MGKLFAIVVTVITIISVAFFVMHTWWLPTDISTTGLAIDHQLDETFVETGILFLAGQLLLGLFVWQASDKNPARKIKIFPGGSTPLVAAAIIVVGIEVLALTFMGSKAWAAINIAPAAADSLHIDVQAEQFAFWFRYAGPDGKFGALHPELIDEADGNYFGLDPRNDVAARDDVVVGLARRPREPSNIADAALQGRGTFFLRAGSAHSAGLRPRPGYSSALHGHANREIRNRLYAIVRLGPLQHEGVPAK